MVPELRSWVQFPPVTYFLPLRIIILTYLAVGGVRTYMTRASGRDSHAGGGMLDYSIRGLPSPSISPEFYGWIG
jgi:hypothetical protein